MLNILQSHYPERLGLSLIINVPFLINTFFKIIMPFVDPITRNKVKFNPSIYEDGLMTQDMVMKEWWGGDNDFKWDHSKYWPALIQMTEERRKNMLQNVVSSEVEMARKTKMRRKVWLAESMRT